MRTTVGIDALEPPGQGSAITIGTFDGVHLGHKALIARTISEANDRGCSSCVVTWDRHPLMTLRPEAAPRLLSTPERKLELLEGTGIDQVAVIPFTDELSHLSPEDFVAQVLVQGLKARAVFVGEGWRFGHKRAGDMDLLQKLGAENGFEAQPVELASGDGDAVSSSRIREAVAAGHMNVARRLLGRPFDIDGLVVGGDKRGTSLGFPTANIDCDPHLAYPARGVYAGRAQVQDSWFSAAINVGVNPTFGGDPEVTPVRVEAFILDFEGDLYGQTIRVEFHQRLRDEMRFTSVDDLIAQMHLDVDATRELFRTP
ncbi:MAG: riboflavin kinase / adenylyltransferase [Actinomycetota bacterium]|jgi:riboflavin kinase/FMN adenylyltransferase|nr:riboflavin kinase / adenylyltransferase [Actinomycetota bacterium]